MKTPLGSIVIKDILPALLAGALVTSIFRVPKSGPVAKPAPEQ